MICRSLACIVTAFAIGYTALPATAAPACEKGNCETSAQSSAGKPLRLKKFVRKPVATSATRTVKKKNGEYAKPKTVNRSALRPASPAVETLSPAAAQAFASYELARVRVLSPDEIGSAQLLASAAASENATTVVSAENVQVVRADEVNVIDRQANSRSAVSLDTLSRDLAGSAPSQPDGDSWFSRMLIVLGGVFAAAAALVRTVLG